MRRKSQKYSSTQHYDDHAKITTANDVITTADDEITTAGDMILIANEDISR